MFVDAIPSFFLAFLIFLRCAGICFTAPIIGSKAVSTSIRIVTAIMLAMAVYAGQSVTAFNPPASLGGLTAIALTETAIGVFAGLTARMTLDMAMVAGQVAGFPMGLGFSAMADPFNGVPSTSLGRLYTMAALAFAVTLGLHREAALWLYQSTSQWPPGSEIDFAAMLPTMLETICNSIAMGVRLSFPVPASVTFGHITLGIVGKSAPQLNLGSVGFSIAILCGGAALYISVNPAAEIAAQMAVNTLTR